MLRFERINLLFLQVSCDRMPFAVLHIASICAGVFLSFFGEDWQLVFFSLCSVSFANGLKVLKPLFDNSTYKGVGLWRQYFVFFLHSEQFSLSALLFCHSLSTVRITHLTSNPTARTKLDHHFSPETKSLSLLEMASSFDVSDDLVRVFSIRPMTKVFPHLKSTKVFAWILLSYRNRLTKENILYIKQLSV